MRVGENRALATAVCVVCAAASVFGFGGLKLHSRYAKAEKVFSHGMETSEADATHNMEAYLSRCARNAADLAQEAKQYLDGDANITKVLDLVSDLSKSDGPTPERYEDYLALSDAVENLYSDLQAAGHSEEVGVTMAYGDYTSAQDLIRRDAYHAAAEAYNDTAGAFPASAIASVWGIRRIETFGN